VQYRGQRRENQSSSDHFASSVTTRTSSGSTIVSSPVKPNQAIFGQLPILVAPLPIPPLEVFDV